MGFVISQDGDVRVMTKVDERLIIWENIQLQLPEICSSNKVLGTAVDGCGGGGDVLNRDRWCGFEIVGPAIGIYLI